MNNANPYLTKLIPARPPMRLHIEALRTHNVYVSDEGLIFVNFASYAGGNFLAGTLEEAEAFHADLGRAIGEARAKKLLGLTETTAPAGVIPC